ncbi:3-oxoacyl-[acyl-carrier-protein] reductase FabG [Paenibacillus baekrokdamisoli]|uniref:3-oxoacyl-[acyl-carrier-protein] reductase FabG n=1 Tax=Paenibacillus baekrokdamisoli TaxID=1712516 RepID=A0A3G9JJH0_9BACL|nr:SDR family NAD(P)-dependent oxidoreductase [Paenibacillus baekrokdamisoli]MBB3071780.1 NAD(P)-dependent dehydrogenase (short-subunit alcohol dehydrogenase family) [Paenibacillus baekrokdamisoli]BBH24238.1 3-oxoacyl-[acyl-carrier-protein] reductase FabG [Paenibacillus baekrokdamisoli]
MGNLDGRVCLVTGAGGGIGRSISLKLASQGANLVLTDINEEQLNDTVQQCCELGVSASGYRIDLTDSTALEYVVEQTKSQFQKIDVLANVAGIMETRSFLEIKADEWNRMFAINVTTTFQLIQLVAKEMIEQGNGGSIINLSSTAGRLHRPMAAHYAASKAAVISLTRSAAVALAPSNIRVNALCPGIIDTPMIQQVRESRSELLDISQDDIQKHWERIIPMGRLASPDEVADLAAFLASDAARYITGEAIGINGGTDAS